jgi:glycosyltransferase involved in cell wall biosynthesis
VTNAASIPRAKRVRLLQVVPSLAIGGLERVVETLTRTVDRDRFEVAVACLREKGPFAEGLESEGFEVHVTSPTPGHPSRWAFRALRHFIREWGPDVVHTHNTEAFLEGAMASVGSGVTTLVHTDHARDFPDKWRYMAAERLASTVAYRVVGVSEATTENLHRYVRIPRKKLITIENGVDGAPFRTAVDRSGARASFGIDAGQPVIGLAARLETQKGIDYLLQALPAVLTAVPDCLLLIAGTGSQEGELRRETERLGLSEQVRFLGDVHEIAQFLSVLDLFLIPSRWEGLPMALLEAMAASRTVVAATVGGIPGVISHGENGWLVPPGDPEALSAGIITLLSNPALRGGLATSALQTFESRYSAEVMARRYEALYLRTSN